MPRKPTGFRLEEEFVARMDAAVAAGLAANRTELVVWAVEKALGDGIASEPRQGKGSFGDTAAPSPAPSRPSKPERLERAQGSAPVRPAVSWLRPASSAHHRPSCRCAVCRPAA